MRCVTTVCITHTIYRGYKRPSAAWRCLCVYILYIRVWLLLLLLLFLFIFFVVIYIFFYSCSTHICMCVKWMKILYDLFPRSYHNPFLLPFAFKKKWLCIQIICHKAVYKLRKHMKWGKPFLWSWACILSANTRIIRRKKNTFHFLLIEMKKKAGGQVKREREGQKV